MTFFAGALVVAVLALAFMLLCVSVAYEQERTRCRFWAQRAMRLEREGREMVTQAQLVSATAKQISAELDRGRVYIRHAARPMGAGLN